jgi:D-glycero-D-manno-heptose 1,7-bisphosphate phosphatase
MSYKAVFLDKDGTLIEDVPYNVRPEQIVFYPDAMDAIYALHQAGYLLVIVSNQSGIARGYFEEQDLLPVEEHIRKEFMANSGVPLAGFYYCPHHPDGIVPRYSIHCDCRKPKPGLLFRAAEELDIDLQHSWMVGDILNDVEAGNQAGCATVLIDNGNETEWYLSHERQPDFIVTNLYEATQAILSGKSVRKYRQPHRMRAYENG